MALSPGTRLGPYEVIALIGSGGEGEVYRARDTKLGRDVALKVLPDLFADDPERLARFQGEARVLASLNHPNIASIYGLEEGGDTWALVLELVEGPTLAERIAQGAIPIDKALPIAKQIAEALEAAHEAGVIHRDLKPANVSVKSDGMVKVLDFGLAKALEPEGSGDPNEAPTRTDPADLGVIRGTAAYMSPEQAKREPVDKRSDIWAFGCVLYEILTGRPAFRGKTSVEILAEVIERSPDFNLLPANLPSSLRQIIRRCLVKDQKGRLRDIGDARLELSDLLATAFQQDAREKSSDADIRGSRANADRGSTRREWTLSLSTPRGRRWVVSMATSVIALVVITVLSLPALRDFTSPASRSDTDSSPSEGPGLREILIEPLVEFPASEMVWEGTIVRLATYEGPHVQIVKDGLQRGHTLGLQTGDGGLFFLAPHEQTREAYTRLEARVGERAQVVGLLFEDAGVPVITVTELP